MNDDLYFIPIVAEAFRSPDPNVAVRSAFARIHELGGEQRFQIGFDQWKRFLALVNATLAETERAAITDAAITIALIRQNTRPVDQNIAPSRIHEIDDLLAALSLLICRNDEQVASLSLAPLDRQFVEGLHPGHYTLALDTGRLLWAGAITEFDLLWSDAFPGRALTMAADSTSSSLSPTRIIPLSVGLLRLGVYPGVETGSVRLLAQDAD